MFKINDIVKIKDTSLEGTILNINSNKCTIKINDKNVIVEKSKLTKMYKSNKNTNNNQIVISCNIDNYEKNKFIPEIMIRHQTVEEAIYNVDLFITDAIYNNAKTVRIIHGKHGGILRKAVHEYLKSNKNISNFRLGNYFEGSYGVTIANIKY